MIIFNIPPVATTTVPILQNKRQIKGSTKQQRKHGQYMCKGSHTILWISLLISSSVIHTRQECHRTGYRSSLEGWSRC